MLLVQSWLSTYLSERKEMMSPASRLQEIKEGLLEAAGTCAMSVYSLMSVSLPNMSYMQRGVVPLVSVSPAPSTRRERNRCSSTCCRDTWVYAGMTPPSGSLTEVCNTVFSLSLLRWFLGHIRQLMIWIIAGQTATGFRAMLLEGCSVALASWCCWLTT